MGKYIICKGINQNLRDGKITKRPIGKGLKELESSLENLEMGDHLCFIYKDKETSLSAIALFVLNGLEKEEKCIYVVDDRKKEEIIEFFKEKGMDVKKYLNSGQFEFLTKKDSYLKNDYFDPDEMIALLKRSEEEALEEGYRGLRVTGEMTWVFTDLPGTERLMEYEMKLNKVLPKSEIIALCQYNEKRFSPVDMVDVIYTHPELILYDSHFENPYYLPPDAFLTRLRGEVTEEFYQRMKDGIKRWGEMKKKEKVANSTLESASIEVFWLDSEGKFVYTNEKVKDRLGYSKEELKDLFVWDIDPNYPREKRQEFWEELKEKKTRTFKSEHETKDGEVFPVEITSQYVKIEGDEYEFAFARDITERERMREELRDKHRQLKTLMSNLPGMVYRSENNKDWTMKFVSEGCEELTGYEPEELIDDKEIAWKEVIHPDDREGVWREVQNALKKKIPFKVTYRIKRSDGEETWVWEKGRGVFDEDGEVKFLEGFIQDITERKWMEKDLREEKKRFKAIAETSPFHIFVYRDKFLYVNPGVEEVTGYTREELLDMNFWEIVAPEHRELVKQRGLSRVEEKGEEPPNNYEFKIQTKDGEERWLLFSGTRIDFKGKPAALGTAVDITERKEVKEELKELSRFREKIIQDAKIWLDVLDNDANVLVWNRAAEEISGYSEEEVVGHDKIWEWLYPDPEYREGVTRTAAEVLEGEELESYETKIQCKNGDEKVISWTSHPLKEEGEIIGSIALGRDITEQKKAEEGKEFLNTLLRQDIHSKSQVAQGYLYLLEDTDLNEEQRGYLEKALKTEREAKEILALAKELREIEQSRWIVGKDICKELEDVLEDLSDLIKERDIEIVKDFPEDISKVKGHYSLNTLFSELLKTRIQTSRCDKIEISMKEKEEQVLIEIQDDGKEIPKDIERLFEGEVYSGFTAGAGGVRYYILKEIADHNKAKIKCGISTMAGAKFKIYLSKA